MSRMDEKMGPNPMKSTDVEEDKSLPNEKGQQSEVRFQPGPNASRNPILNQHLQFFFFFFFNLPYRSLQRTNSHLHPISLAIRL
jgi:hypothetical protein